MGEGEGEGEGEGTSSSHACSDGWRAQLASSRSAVSSVAGMGGDSAAAAVTSADLSAAWPAGVAARAATEGRSTSSRIRSSAGKSCVRPSARTNPP